MGRFLLFVVFIWSSAVAAADIKPIMIYDSKLIMDKSWNEAIHNGITKFEKKSHIPVREVSVVTVDAFGAAVTMYAKEGYNPIMINHLNDHTNSLIMKVMLKYPSQRFVVFNGTFNAPNAHYFVFSSQESSFLAGYLAVKKSPNKKLGFIGGMDIPLIRNFMCGYIKGAKYADKNAQVISAFISDDLTAWASPDKAYQIAGKQIAEGADVIFAPAGGSAWGALKAAHDKGVLGIGVDSNQNDLYPGSVLTSAMVRVDNAAYRALMASYQNIWRDQMKIMGLQEKGVELAFDKYNAHLISPEMRKEIAQLEADIVLGKIRLPNYVFDEKCSGTEGPLF